LVEASEEMLNDLNSETLKKRTLHVIQENRRVQNIKQLLNSLDVSRKDLEEVLQQIGKFLYDSHESLKNYYEVSCYELDVIVEESKKISGVYGARMTGAGFGGCAIALVDKKNVEEYIPLIAKIYRERTNLIPDVFEVQIEDGVNEL
jgi:galactokinase